MQQLISMLTSIITLVMGMRLVGRATSGVLMQRLPEPAIPTAEELETILEELVHQVDPRYTVRVSEGLGETLADELSDELLYPPFPAADVSGPPPARPTREVSIYFMWSVEEYFHRVGSRVAWDRVKAVLAHESGHIEQYEKEPGVWYRTGEAGEFSWDAELDASRKGAKWAKEWGVLGAYRDFLSYATKDPKMPAEVRESYRVLRREVS